MVKTAAPIVARRRSDVGRKGIPLADQLLQAGIVVLAVGLQQGVQLLHIVAEMFAVMQLHGLSADIGLQSGRREIQGRQLKRVVHIFHQSASGPW